MLYLNNIYITDHREIKSNIRYTQMQELSCTGQQKDDTKEQANQFHTRLCSSV